MLVQFQPTPKGGSPGTIFFSHLFCKDIKVKASSECTVTSICVKILCMIFSCRLRMNEEARKGILQSNTLRWQVQFLCWLVPDETFSLFNILLKNLEKREWCYFVKTQIQVRFLSSPILGMNPNWQGIRIIPFSLHYFAKRKGSKESVTSLCNENPHFSIFSIL